MTGERTDTVNPEEIKKEILAKYPPKVARKTRQADHAGFKR